MAACLAALIAAPFSLTVSILKNLCINYVRRHRRQTFCRLSGGNCRMIHASIRMTTSVTIRVGGMIQGCISPAKAATTVRSPATFPPYLRKATVYRWHCERGRNSMRQLGKSLRKANKLVLPPETCIAYLTLEAFLVWRQNASHGLDTMPVYFLYPPNTVHTCSN